MIRNSNDVVYICEDVEVWKFIPGYSIYQASSLGRIRSIDRIVECKGLYKPMHCKNIRGRILIQKTNHRGYSEVRLRRALTQVVHKLVAYSFLGERPKGYQINHIDGNKLNNAASNLEYCTQSQNMIHAHKLGLIQNPKGENHHNSKLSNKDVEAMFELYNSGKTVNEIKDIYKISNTNIREILKGRSWKHFDGNLKIRDDRALKSEESIKRSLITRTLNKRKSRSKPIAQIDITTNNIIDEFDSINKAAIITKVPRRSISYAIDNFKGQTLLPLTRGFYWKVEESYER